MAPPTPCSSVVELFVNSASLISFRLAITGVSPFFASAVTIAPPPAFAVLFMNFPLIVLIVPTFAIAPPK